MAILRPLKTRRKNLKALLTLLNALSKSESEFFWQGHRARTRVRNLAYARGLIKNRPFFTEAG